MWNFSGRFLHLPHHQITGRCSGYVLNAAFRLLWGSCAKHGQAGLIVQPVRPAETCGRSRYTAFTVDHQMMIICLLTSYSCIRACSCANLWLIFDP